MRKILSLLLVGAWMGGCPKPAVQSPTASTEAAQPTSQTIAPREVACSPGDDSCGVQGGVVPKLKQPVKIKERCAPPVYPEDAKKAGLTGIVKLRVTISAEGKVSKITLVEGTPEFIDAATTYLKSCEYVPAQSEDKAIEVTKLEVIKFTLR